ncbi:hypothetical protein K2173_016613 [Erythroxylum novogranatense]|uniref:DUF4283 domain-containing protein n=1 Tax=Erythroxylum novogranatense TaxID=1862640 RepID=A0AAV8SSP2_9ROSI|nr:hypothetical protein K2173_016613 [Erythroxylum novogranatense]
MVDLDNEFYLAKFQEEGDYFKVLTEGPWVVFGQVVAVQRWSPSFRPSQATISQTIVWIRIPNLPISHYHPEILSVVGDLVGSTIRLDEETLLINRGNRSAPPSHAERRVGWRHPSHFLRGSSTDTAGTAGAELRDFEGASGGEQNPTASNGYGPWTHVQRRRPHPTNG